MSNKNGKDEKNQFEGFKHVSLTPDQIIKLMSMEDDKIFDYLEQMYSEQNEHINNMNADSIREMLGEDNTCDCPDCRKAKERVKMNEDQLKKTSFNSGIMDALFDIFADDEMKKAREKDGSHTLSEIDPNFPDFMDDMLETFGEAIEAETQSIKEDFMKLNQIQEIEEPMPEWALHRASSKSFVKMTQLNTRDGRETGNAVVFDISMDTATYEPRFHIITDAGNILTLTVDEMMDMFHEPEWVMKELPNDWDQNVSEKISEWYEKRYGPINHYS